MSVDNYLLKVADQSWITHTARGILSDNEFQKYEEHFITIECRELDCRHIETFPIELFYESPFLFCSNCESKNITGKWMEYNTQFEQYDMEDSNGANNVYFDENIEPNQKTFYLPHIPEIEPPMQELYSYDPYYGILFHIHYQRDESL